MVRPSALASTLPHTAGARGGRSPAGLAPASVPGGISLALTSATWRPGSTPSTALSHGRADAFPLTRWVQIVIGGLLVGVAGLITLIAIHVLQPGPLSPASPLAAAAVANVAVPAAGRQDAVVVADPNHQTTPTHATPDPLDAVARRARLIVSAAGVPTLANLRQQGLPIDAVQLVHVSGHPRARVVLTGRLPRSAHDPTPAPFLLVEPLPFARAATAVTLPRPRSYARRMTDWLVSGAPRDPETLALLALAGSGHAVVYRLVTGDFDGDGTLDLLVHLAIGSPTDARSTLAVLDPIAGTASPVVLPAAPGDDVRLRLIPVAERFGTNADLLPSQATWRIERTSRAIARYLPAPHAHATHAPLITETFAIDPRRPTGTPATRLHASLLAVTLPDPTTPASWLATIDAHLALGHHRAATALRATALALTPADYTAIATPSDPNLTTFLAVAAALTTSH